jgi:hypothetical protein
MLQLIKIYDQILNPHFNVIKSSFRRKIFLISFGILFIMFNGNAQITKGNWLVGGNATLESTKYRAGAVYNQTVSEIGVNPTIGYFFLDKFSAGLKTSISIRIDKFDRDTEHTTRLNFGPFVRYYFLPVSNMVNILAEGSYGYATGVNINKGKRISFFTGPVIFLNNVIGLEFLVGYTSVKYRKLTETDNSILMNIGLQVHLEKNK